MTLSDCKKYITEGTEDYICFLNKINYLIESGFIKNLIESDKIQFNQFAVPLKNELLRKFIECKPDPLLRNFIILKTMDEKQFSRLSGKAILVLKYYERMNILFESGTDVIIKDCSNINETELFNKRLNILCSNE